MAAGGVGGSKITDAVRAAFNNIIGNPGKTKTNALIDGLKYKDAQVAGFFTDASTSLPALTGVFSMIPDVNNPGTMIEDLRGPARIGDEPVTYIGGGAYGTIFLGNSNRVYKRTTKKDYLDAEEFHKELFMEPFIQTLLQNDVTYGKNIAKLMGVYRDSGAVAASTRPRTTVSATGARSVAPIRESNYTYYYVMEPIAYNIDRYIGAVPPTVFITKLQEIGTVLEYFKTNYGFYHCDLHGDNIMYMHPTGDIKIIDFGLSCITDAGTVYSVDTKECNSWDLLIYITWLRQYNVIPIYNGLFNRLLSHGANNLYNIVTASSECPDDGNGKVTWHAMYKNRMNPPSGVWNTADTITDGMSLIAFFNTYLYRNFEPAAFSDYWARVSADLAAGGDGMTVRTPSEIALGIIPAALQAPLAAPLQAVMGTPARALAKRGCCKRGVCGLCGGHFLVKSAQKYTFKKRFLEKSVAKRYLRKSMAKRLRKSITKKGRANKTRRSN